MSRGVFLAACTLVGVLTGALVHFGGRPDGGAGGRPGEVEALVGRVVPADAADAAMASVPEGSGVAAGLAPDGEGAGTGARGVRPAPVYSYHDGIMRVAPSVVSLYASATGAAGSRTGGARETTADAAAGAAVPAPRSGSDDGGADRGRQRLSQGSGVVVDPDGIVLTNLHLVEGADTINVVLADGTPHTGRLVGSDRETDLAVVEIDPSGVPARGLAAVDLDDAPPLRVGDVVLAIGNPFGVGQTVTQGIVSATRRRVAGGSAWQDFVQIDAAINPGSSGGALINPAGQLVGVTTAVFRGSPPTTGGGASGGGPAEGIGFAIPAELLSRVVPEIIADGRVVRGWLGVGADDLPMFPELHRRVPRGAVITGVLPDSPAARGGLVRRDVVTRVDGRAIEDATDLLLLVSSLGPGSEIRLAVERDGESRELSVRLGERPPLDGGGPR